MKTLLVARRTVTPFLVVVLAACPRREATNPEHPEEYLGVLIRELAEHARAEAGGLRAWASEPGASGRDDLLESPHLQGLVARLEPWIQSHSSDTPIDWHKPRARRELEKLVSALAALPATNFDPPLAERIDIGMIRSYDARDSHRQVADVYFRPFGGDGEFTLDQRVGVRFRDGRWWLDAVSDQAFFPIELEFGTGKWKVDTEALQQ
ncbi:MAG TPA: hypothetical protein VGC54_06515 [Planctomycetota bacterium]